MEASAPTPLVITATVVGIGLIGLLDYLTGTELRIFPLYFLPLSLAAWYLDRGSSIFFSVLANLVWGVAILMHDPTYSHSYVWVINFLTQGSAFLVVSLMVESLRKSLHRERALSRTDPLTGLLNRRGLLEESERIVGLCHRQQRAITLAYLDLDNFKQANDTKGHDYGDMLLKAVASIFADCLRSTDVVGRIGGDEFAILLPETLSDDAWRVLERIRTTIADEPAFQACHVTASIGAVSYAHSPPELRTIIRAADNAMYEVKALMKNQVHVENGNPADGLVL